MVLKKDYFLQFRINIGLMIFLLETFLHPLSGLVSALLDVVEVETFLATQKCELFIKSPHHCLIKMSLTALVLDELSCV